MNLVGLRNVVVHEYFAIDLDVVWVIIKQNLPQLKEAVLSVLGNS